MSKLRRKASRRVLAVALSAAMVMSNLTVYASEATEPIVETVVETVVETEETESTSVVEIEDEDVPVASTASEDLSSEAADD